MFYMWEYLAFGICHLVFHKCNTGKTMLHTLERIKMNLLHLQVKNWKGTQLAGTITSVELLCFKGPS